MYRDYSVSVAALSKILLLGVVLEVVVLEVVVLGVLGVVLVSMVVVFAIVSVIECVQSPSLRDKLTTVHCESTVTSSSVTLKLGPLETQSSMRLMSDPLSFWEVPSNLA